MRKVVMGFWNRNYRCAELIYWEEDKFSASKFFYADTETKLSFCFDSPYNAKVTLEVTYEMSLNQRFYYLWDEFKPTVLLQFVQLQ